MCLSTPFGQRGWFFEQWSGNDATWERIKVPATHCPRIDKSFLDEQKRLFGPRWASQEFDCEFIEAKGQVFSNESIMAAFDSDVPALPGI
jgi:hypothetical protein